MMFVDESGDPGYPSDGNWGRWGGSPMFCRLGVIIHGWRWKAWNDKVYQFKIQLQEVKPPVWRRIRVPASSTFWDLHVAIQDSMDGPIHTCKSL